MASYNKLKSTTVFGTFQNADASGNQANATFDRNLTVSGILNTAHIQNNSGDIDISANNVIFKGGHVQFNNDSKIDIHQYGTAYPPPSLQFPTIDMNTVSTVANNGMAFYSNLSGGANESNFVSFCPWQGGGGFSFYAYSLNQKPQKIAEFLPWGAYIGTYIQFSSTYTAGEYGATTNYVQYCLGSYLLSSTANSTFETIADVSANYLKKIDASNNYASLSTNNTYNGINTFNSDLTVSGIINTSKLYNNSGNIDLSGNYINIKSFKISKFIMIPNTSTPSSATLLSGYGCYYFNGNTPYISFNNGTTINTDILATSADLYNYLKTVDASNNFLSITNASSTYLTISNASSTYLTTTNASITYQPISSMSNYITKGASIPFNTNIATLQFLSSFPTAAVNNNNTGLGLFWNNTGGGGEVDLISFGQASSGGFSFWCAGNVTAPTQLAYFYLNNINFTYNPSFPSTTNIGNYGATTSWVNTYFQPQSSMSNYLTTSSATSTYLSKSSASSTYMPLASMTAYPQLSTSNTFTGSTNTFTGNFVFGTSALNLTVSNTSNYMLIDSTSSTNCSGIIMNAGTGVFLIDASVIDLNGEIRTNSDVVLLKDTVNSNSQDPRIVWYNGTPSIVGQIYANSSTSEMIFDSPYTFVFTGNGVVLGNGLRGKQGINGSSRGNTMNQWWTGSSLQAWVDVSNIGTFTISDYRIKEHIQPCSDVLDRLCSVPMFNYELKDISIFKKNGTHCGFYAHELQEVFPELNNIVSGEKDALNDEGEIQPQTIQPEFCNLLMKAIQELNEKVIQLTNRIAELEKK